MYFCGGAYHFTKAQQLGATFESFLRVNVSKNQINRGHGQKMNLAHSLFIDRVRYLNERGGVCFLKYSNKRQKSNKNRYDLKIQISLRDNLKLCTFRAILSYT
jgi:hypothetical protein